MSNEEQPAHAKYAPSASPIWTLCGGSTTIDVSDVDDSDQHSDRGTRLHAAAAYCLENGAHPTSDYTLAEMPEDAASVRQYVEWVKEQPGRHFIEKRTEWIDGLCGGTTDCAVVSPDGLTLHVIDYKAGFVQHSPIGNTQLAIYALGMMRWLAPVYRFKWVRLTICQPMHWEEGTEPPTWTVPANTILEMGDTLRARVEALERRDPEAITFAPRKDTCRFCTVGRSRRCPALAEAAQVAAEAAFDEWAKNQPAPLGPTVAGAPWVRKPVAELTELEQYELADVVELWAKHVKESITTKVLLGTNVPGFKQVAGRRRRTVSDPKGLVAYLTNEGMGERDIYPGEPAMVTPAKAEKLFKGRGAGEKKAALSQFFTSEEGPTKVVPDYDNRPAVDPTDKARRAFADWKEES